MIICQCTTITDREIRTAIEWMLLADPAARITPAKIYRALGKHADCGTCISLFVETMRKEEAAVGTRKQNGARARPPVPILTTAAAAVSGL